MLIDIVTVGVGKITATVGIAVGTNVGANVGWGIGVFVGRGVMVGVGVGAQSQGLLTPIFISFTGKDEN